MSGRPLYTVLATAVPVLFIGWVTLVAGLVGVVAALFRIGRDGFWLTAVGGGLLTVLGLVLVRNPAVAAATLTLLVSALFMASGGTRIVAAVQPSDDRWILLIGGVISLFLGLFVVFNFVQATLTLLGVLLGVEAFVEGVLLLLVGRVHVRRRKHDPR